MTSAHDAPCWISDLGQSRCETLVRFQSEASSLARRPRRRDQCSDDCRLDTSDSKLLKAMGLECLTFT